MPSGKIVYDGVMRLYLIRHGIAIDRGDPDCPPEATRHLTEKGLWRTRRAAAGLFALGVKPGLLIASPYVRAIQTAEIFAEELGSRTRKIKTSAALEPMAQPERIFAELSKLDVPREGVMLFGHAPHLDLALRLALGARAGATEIKKSGVALIELDSIVPPRGMLAWLMTPRALRAVSKEK